VTPFFQQNAAQRIGDKAGHQSDGPEKQSNYHTNCPVMVAETGKYDVVRHKKKNYGYQHQHGNKGRENCYQPLKGYLQSVPGFSPACNQRDNQGQALL
jgi:hypothetical protein